MKTTVVPVLLIFVVAIGLGGALTKVSNLSHSVADVWSSTPIGHPSELPIDELGTQLQRIAKELSDTSLLRAFHSLEL